MIAYSFQKRFIKPIQDGTKVFTLRAPRKREHARVGQTLQLYFGMRTKHCRKIIDDLPCAARGEGLLHFEKGNIVNIERDGTYVDDLDAFSRCDGFSDVDDMTLYWHRLIKEAGHEKPSEYTGRSLPLNLIGWVDLFRIGNSDATAKGFNDETKSKRPEAKSSQKPGNIGTH